MLNIIKNGLLNNDKVIIFNNKIVVVIFIPNANKHIVIIQQNTIRHIIY